MRLSTFSPVSGTALGAPSAQAALLNLHSALAFNDLWTSLQGLLETLVPHDTLVMSVNYLDWKRESSTGRFSSKNSRRKHDHVANGLVAAEGRSFFQPFLDAHPGIAAYRHSQLVSDPRKIDRNRYYRNYMRRYGWRYSAHLLFWQGSDVETSFALRRRAEQGDFTPAEMDVLGMVHPHIQVAFERMKRFEQERQRRRLLEGFYRAKPEAVLFLGWDLDLIYASQEALALCAVWNLGPERARSYSPQAVFSIPESIATQCSELRQEWQRQSPALQAGEEFAPIRCVPGPQPGDEALVTLRREKSGNLTKPVFVVRFRIAEPSVVTNPNGMDPASAQRLHHELTPGERELAHLVCAGLTNKEIAEQLNKTEGSVKVQLSRIFQKLRVNSRAKLIVALR